MKIVTVIGARPQFIKASVVSEALKNKSDMCNILLHTGQHYDANMSDIFFDELGIERPLYNLGIGKGHHGEMTGRMLEQIERVLLTEDPSAVVVYGDTNSTLAGALAAAKLHIPVAHVEAGLRSFNKTMPEEINRMLTDRISDWLFAPTEEAARNLKNEGLLDDNIDIVGDVMYDVALHYARRADGRSGEVLGALGCSKGNYVLATIHRAANTDDRDALTVIVDALRIVGHEVRVIWPIHPRTAEAMRRFNLLDILDDGVKVVDPFGYLEMVCVERNAAAIVTDSGGVQKEAYFHEVPCVTVRRETEWVELVEAGWNRLAPPDSSGAVAKAVLGSIHSRGQGRPSYGGGNAAKRIVERLHQDL